MDNNNMAKLLPASFAAPAFEQGLHFNSTAPGFTRHPIMTTAPTTSWSLPGRAALPLSPPLVALLYHLQQDPKNAPMSFPDTGTVMGTVVPPSPARTRSFSQHPLSPRGGEGGDTEAGEKRKDRQKRRRGSRDRLWAQLEATVIGSQGLAPPTHTHHTLHRPAPARVHPAACPHRPPFPCCAWQPCDCQIAYLTHSLHCSLSSVGVALLHTFRPII